MNRIIALVVVLSAILISGCVRRTVLRETEYRGATPTREALGGEPESKVVEKKTIWIWQDEFRKRK